MKQEISTINNETTFIDIKNEIDKNIDDYVNLIQPHSVDFIVTSQMDIANF